MSTRGTLWQNVEMIRRKKRWSPKPTAKKRRPNWVETFGSKSIMEWRDPRYMNEIYPLLQPSSASSRARDETLIRGGRWIRKKMENKCSEQFMLIQTCNCIPWVYFPLRSKAKMPAISTLLQLRATTIITRGWSPLWKVQSQRRMEPLLSQKNSAPGDTQSMQNAAIDRDWADDKKKIPPCVRADKENPVFYF